MSQSSEIRNLMKAKFQEKQNRIGALPGQLGDGYGHIAVTGREHYVYCRLAGSTVEVFNNRVPAENDLLVMVGYDPTQPDLFQVLSTRSAVPGGISGGAVTGYASAKRYQWFATDGGQDPVFIEKRQYLPLRIGPLSGMLLQVYRDFIWSGTQWIAVNTQNFSLSSYIPTTTGKAALVLITIDNTGAIVKTKGAEVDIAALSITDLPTPPAGTVEVLGAVRVYYGQTAILEARTNTDIIDLRDTWNTGGSSATIANHDHSGDTGDGGAFPLVNLLSTGASSGQVATSNGSGGITWETPATGGVPNTVTADISTPPTDQDFISAFGEPTTVQLGLLKSTDGARQYLGAADGSNWWYQGLTKAKNAVTPTNLALDLFTDTSNTALAAHTMDTGAGWTVQTGVWTIQSNTAQNSQTTEGRKIATVSPGVSSAMIHLALKTLTTGNSSAGVILRYQDTSNYWLVQIDTNYQKFDLVEVNGGTATTRATKSWPKQLQKAIELDVTVSGNTITAWVDGGYSITYTSSFLAAANKFGIAEYQTTGYNHWSFDEFEIIPLPVYTWTRHGTVIEDTLTGIGNISEQCVIYDTNPQLLTSETSVFKMWYGAGWDTMNEYYAESADGINWTKKAEVVITNHMTVNVVKDGTDYWAFARNQSNFNLDLLHSTDGVAWTLDTADIVAKGSTGAWDDNQLASNAVWKESDGSWKMIYGGVGASGTWDIGYATGSDVRTWTKSASNPVATNVGGWWVKKVGDYYYFWSSRATAGGMLPSIGIHRYRSTDLITWTPYPYHAVANRVGATNGEDTYTGQLCNSYIAEVNGTAYLFTTVASDGGASTGHAQVELFTADARAITGW